MRELAIRVENISKQYRLGNLQSRYKTIRENFTDILLTPFRQLRPTEAKTIWALKEVSFEVKPGEVLGIIGRNGAGKSTLLKIISRITRPTQGRIEMYGRVGSLLEVGTGFHPELTGRENIYLSGAVLGMKKVEIGQKFDEIVAFAELEQFIDTPVKRYSSGMYMRLAFAVAAHLEPEILLIDEVLAVGDAGFQQKCLRKMEKIGSEGRTILFVSHNMLALTTLCTRAILLKEGRVTLTGNPYELVQKYLGEGGITAEKIWPILEAPGDNIARLYAVRICDEEGNVCDAVDIRKKVGIQFDYEVLKSGQVLTPTFSLHTDTGILVFWAGDTSSEWASQPRPEGRYLSTVWIPGNFLSAGTMIIGVTITSTRPIQHVHLYEREVLSFQVIDSMGDNTARGNYKGAYPGAVRPLLPWTNKLKQKENC